MKMPSLVIIVQRTKKPLAVLAKGFSSFYVDALAQSATPS